METHATVDRPLVGFTARTVINDIANYERECPYVPQLVWPEDALFRELYSKHYIASRLTGESTPEHYERRLFDYIASNYIGPVDELLDLSTIEFEQREPPANPSASNDTPKPLTPQEWIEQVNEIMKIMGCDDPAILERTLVWTPTDVPIRLKTPKYRGLPVIVTATSPEGLWRSSVLTMSDCVMAHKKDLIQRTIASCLSVRIVKRDKDKMNNTITLLLSASPHEVAAATA